MSRWKLNNETASRAKHWLLLISGWIWFANQSSKNDACPVWLKLNRARTTLFCLLILLVAHAAGLTIPCCIAQQAQHQITRSFTEPCETSEVAAAEQGIVKKINIKEGQFINAGDVLAELDNDVLIESRRLAEAAVKSKARINAAAALLNLQKMQKENFAELIEQGHANASEVRKVNAEYEAALAELEMAHDEATRNRIELDRINAQIKRRQIVSPMDAVVTEIHRRKGEFISANDPKFVTIVRLDQLKVRFYLHVNDLDKLQAGRTVDVLIGSSSRPYQAVVDFVSPVIDPNSGTGRVDVIIENPGNKIRSGVVCHWNAVSNSTANPRTGFSSHQNVSPR